MQLGDGDDARGGRQLSKDSVISAAETLSAGSVAAVVPKSKTTLSFNVTIPETTMLFVNDVLFPMRPLLRLNLTELTMGGSVAEGDARPNGMGRAFSYQSHVSVGAEWWDNR